MFELNPGPFRPLGTEPHLDLAGVQRVGVVLPGAVDLPGDQDPKRWLPCQHSSPIALAAVLPAFVPPSTLAGLQDGLSHFRLADVKLARPPRVERGREDTESLFDGRADSGGSVDRRDSRCVAHDFSSNLRDIRGRLGGLLIGSERLIPNAVE